MTRPTAFISHHSSQYRAAKTVKAALAEAGVDGWLAPDDIEPGATFDTAIVDQVNRSALVVLLLCAQSDRSRHVKRELMIADDAHKPIFPVRIEPVEADGLAYWLKDKQWIDWIGCRGDGLDRLVSAIRRRTGDATPVPAPVSARRLRRLPLWLGAGAMLIATTGLAAWLLVPGLTAPKPYVEPGLWLNKREMIAINYPEVTADAAKQIKGLVENDPNPEECVLDAVARNPDVRLFDPGNKGGCTLSAFQIGSGRMSGYLTCPMPGVRNGLMQVAFRGTYSRTAIQIDQDITMTQPQGSLQFKARDTSQWIATDCGRDAR